MTLIKVATVDKIEEGGMIAVDANGNSIMLAKVGGKIHAIENMCSHAGGSLNEGYIDGNEAVCPLHAARYDIATGKVAPDTMWGKGQKPFTVKIEGKDVLVEV